MTVIHKTLHCHEFHFAPVKSRPGMHLTWGFLEILIHCSLALLPSTGWISKIASAISVIGYGNPYNTRGML